MDKIRQFEDLLAWQKARTLAQEVDAVVRSGCLARDFRLIDQIRAATASVMANVAEGFERSRPAEFQRFLSIAKGSCGEVRSHLYVALDRGYLSEAQFNTMRLKAAQTSQVIGALRRAVLRHLEAARSR